MIELAKNNEYIELKKKFDDFYLQNLYPILQENDKVRRKFLSFFIVLVLMACLFYPFILWLILRSSLTADNSSLGYIIAASGIVLMILGSPMYLYRKQVKPQIMPVFAKFFGDFQYTYERCLDDAVLKKSGLFKPYNNNRGDDFFHGYYEDVEITVAEEKLRDIQADMSKKKTERKIFSGVCILLEMNKNFSGRTLVLEDKWVFNSFNRVSGLQNVKLEDSKFEKYFEVYSDSQIEARYLLTTGFMERMLFLQELYEGKSMQFSFQNNQLLIAIRTKQNMFEANSFFRSNINRQRIDVVFDQFFTIFSIIKILKLNQRIGL